MSASLPPVLLTTLVLLAAQRAGDPKATGRRTAPQSESGRAPASLVLWHEDGRNPYRTPEFKPELYNMARAARTLNADLIMVGHPGFMVRIWTEDQFRPAVERATGTRLVCGLKIDGCGCVDDPTDPNVWALVSSVARELFEKYGVDRMVMGDEACMAPWWSRGWDDARMRRGIASLPPGPTYYIYPAMTAGWPGVSDADCLQIEIWLAKWQDAWRQLPRVVFPAHSQSGMARPFSWAEQRSINLAMARHLPCTPMVSICDTCPPMVPAEKAAKVLALAPLLPHPTFVYLCGTHEPVGRLAERVAKIKAQFEKAQP